jgi:citronellol/citronellal dehydrogenase
VAFLLSPASAYTTGALLKVDGASSLWAQMVAIEDHSSNEPFDGFHRAFKPDWLPSAP